MAPLAHSHFSASASYRLLACPGSYEAARLVDTGVRRSSIYSAEGTLAHSIAETCLASGTNPDRVKGQVMRADGFEFEVNDDMEDAVAVYVDTLRSLRALGYVIIFEHRVSPTWAWGLWSLDMSGINIDLFGTSDCIAYHPELRHLVIIDYKHGRGVPVDVKGNPQLLYYGAGALDPLIVQALCDKAGVPYNAPENVSLVVCQPRAFHPDGPVRKEDYTYQEVLDWNRFVLYPGVIRALTDKGQTFAAGKHCRFCPVASACPTMRDFTLETARLAFREAPIENLPADAKDMDAIKQEVILPEFDLSDERLGDLLDRIAIVGPWIEGLKTLAAERLEAGRPVKGWKLVPKAARRHWAAYDTEQELVDALRAAGLTDDEFMETSVKSPAAVERAVGKRRYAAAVQPHVGKSSSGTTLAPDGDPRSRLAGRTAREVFNISTD